MTDFQPMHDGVLIRPDTIDKVTESGLHVERAVELQPSSGVVLAVGPGVLTLMGERIGSQVEPGDVVYFPPYGAAAELTLDWAGEEDQALFLCSESQILGFERDVD